MSPKPISVLISGAGVAGVALALALSRQVSSKAQPQITIVERSPVPRTSGQAVDIRGPAVTVIQRLGLEPAIQARHTSETGLLFLDEQGSTVARFDASGDPKKQSATSEYEILRGELTELLLDELKAAQDQGANVQIVYGESITSLQDHTNGVDVQFSHGMLENQTYDIVVGADGAFSKTRTMIFDEEQLKDNVKPSGMYIAFFSVPRIPGDDELWRWCTLPGGLAMHLRPHRSQETMGVYLTITNSEKAPNPDLDAIMHDGEKAQRDYLSQRFRSSGWQSERFIAALEGASDFYMTHWCQVKTPLWTKDRCAIVGDAAFAQMGIGTSLALVGAYVLAGELCKAEFMHVSTALQKYEQTIRPLVAKYDIPMIGFPQMANPQTVFGVGLLRAALRTAVALKLPQLAMWLSFGDDDKSWLLPEYPFQQQYRDS